MLVPEGVDEIQRESFANNSASQVGLASALFGKLSFTINGEKSINYPGGGLDDSVDSLNMSTGRLNDEDLQQSRITYYQEKFGWNIETEEDSQKVDALKNSFIEAIYWVYHYYFHGCISWSWFYPHHYTPMLCGNFLVH